MLVVEDKYKSYFDFKRFVLEKSMKELRKKSDIYFSYETKKQGRKVHSIVFHIKKQRQRRLFISDDFVENKTVLNVSDKKIKQLQKDYDEGFSYTEFTKDFDEE